MEYYINQFLFGVYPYIAGSIFIFGSILRFERGQYTWRAMSSQMLTPKSRHFRRAGVAFHVAILLLFFGHLAGLLTPSVFYEGMGLTRSNKQILAMAAGGAAGLVCLYGLTYLLWRRLFVVEVRANSAPMDTFIICLIWLQLVTGLGTVIQSFEHLDGATMQALAHWAQHIVTFRSGAHEFILTAHWTYKVHVFLGMVMFTVFPFSRLVHIWSWPWAYTRRKYQVVRMH